jgi:hypothetical protein
MLRLRLKNRVKYAEISHAQESLTTISIKYSKSQTDSQKESVMYQIMIE